jgi:hypothetical protein
VETISRRICAGVWGDGGRVSSFSKLRFRSRCLMTLTGFSASLGIFETSRFLPFFGVAESYSCLNTIGTVSIASKRTRDPTLPDEDFPRKGAKAQRKALRFPESSFAPLRLCGGKSCFLTIAEKFRRTDNSRILK